MAITRDNTPVGSKFVASAPELFKGKRLRAFQALRKQECPHLRMFVFQLPVGEQKTFLGGVESVFL